MVPRRGKERQAKARYTSGQLGTRRLKQWPPGVTTWWAETPKLELNLTAQEWKRWRSSLASYKRHARLTDHTCLHVLPVWLLQSRARDSGQQRRLSDNDADLNEEQFLERRRRSRSRTSLDYLFYYLPRLDWRSRSRSRTC